MIHKPKTLLDKYNNTIDLKQKHGNKINYVLPALLYRGLDGVPTKSESVNKDGNVQAQKTKDKVSVRRGW